MSRERRVAEIAVIIPLPTRLGAAFPNLFLKGRGSRFATVNLRVPICVI